MSLLLLFDSNPDYFSVGAGGTGSASSGSGGRLPRSATPDKWTVVLDLTAFNGQEVSPSIRGLQQKFFDRDVPSVKAEVKDFYVDRQSIEVKATIVHAESFRPN